eukprot:gene34613-42697_t
MEEVQRMRNNHQVLNDKRNAEELAAKSTGKGKLEERLAAKRVKKEKELKEAEEKAMADLAVRQAAEAEEREKNRLSKMVWSERVEEIVDKSRSLGLAPRETEDYCFSETLGKRLVPDNQMSEAVSLIQKQRHDQEMTALLTSHFEERVAVLKNAVEHVIEQKSAAKVQLLEALTRDGVFEDQIAKQIAQLDGDYNARQLEAEKRSTAELEPVHMKAQMDLRQSQLQEMASVVARFTDPESLARMQNATGKSQEDEMNEYRAKIEGERRAREEALQKERQETEAALRTKLTEDLQKVQNELVEEQRRAEVEFEKKRLEVVKQREELEKKNANDVGELDNLEKQRIMSNFEKENAAALDALDRDRKDKKNKLTDRLNRRKSTVLNITPMTMPSKELVNSSAAVQDPRKSMTRTASAKSMDGKMTTSPEFSQSMQTIEAKLERIEKVIMALEKNGFPQSPVHVAAQPAIPSIQEGDEESEKDSAAVTQPAGENSAVTAPVEVKPKAPKRKVDAPPPAVIPAYSDRDEPTPGDSVDVVPDDSIQIQERARIDFGKKLATMIGLKTLNIKAASSLPPSKASNNAFCNSYLYTAKDNTLVVHTNRLGSSGDFGLVVIHALSHIKVNPEDLSNDADPRFLAEFYKNLKLLSQDLYKKSAAVTQPNTHSAANRATPAKAAAERGPALRKGPTSKFGGSFSGANPEMQAAIAALNTLEPSPSVEALERNSSRMITQSAQELFSPEGLYDRMKSTAAQDGIPLDYMDRYAAYKQLSAQQQPVQQSGEGKGDEAKRILNSED